MVTKLTLEELVHDFSFYKGTCWELEGLSETHARMVVEVTASKSPKAADVQRIVGVRYYRPRRGQRSRNTVKSRGGVSGQYICTMPHVNSYI